MKGFHSCIGAYTFMGAYNKFRSQHCCHNDFLINGILKSEWGYDGVFISDWYGAHDTEQSVYNGLDIEMGTEHPYDEYFLANPFLKMAQTSEKAAEILDEKARRILRLMFRIGKFDPNRKRGSYNTEFNQSAAYKIASEAMVLLKNDLAVLPIQNSPETILVVGENAVREHAHGGGSSGVKALYETTLLDGIKRAFPKAHIEYVAAAGLDFKPIPVDYLSIADTATGCRAFKCETFENSDYTGKKTIEYKAEISDVESCGAARVFVGELNIPKYGNYYFEVTGAPGVQVFFGNETVCEITDGKGKAVVHKQYCKGETVLIIIKVKNSEKTTFRWSLNDDASNGIEDLCERARRASAVIYCGGLNHNYDSEAFDRKNMKLPDVQNREITALLNVRPDTVIALTGGSPVEMPWIDKAHAVIWTWYSGLEGGNVFGDILIGKINPSGKLPVTFPKRLEDSPFMRYGEYDDVSCTYKEGSLVGYRGFEADRIKPLFAFGHGLSYTEWKYSDVSVSSVNGAVKVELMLKNIGKVKGGETVQVYFGPSVPEKGAVRKELKGFEKVFLESGEEKRISVTLDAESLQSYSLELECDVAPSGEYKVYVGSSSDDIRFEKTITL